MTGTGWRTGGPGAHLVAPLRSSWRQLTSMRTALVLLFLLAVAAIPGSVLPQRNVNIENVNAYFVANPRLAPVLDRIGAFDVYTSPWFSAIYLLLFTSLVGCVLPRLREHLRALRAAPPDAPQRLERLPQHAAGLRHDGVPAAAAADLHAGLRARRWRSVVRDHADGSVTVSAEKGYLKETGNLLFHAALVAVLVGVGLGAWYGWHGNRLVVAGADTAFCNTLSQYDEYGVGAGVDEARLAPFCFELTSFDAAFLESGQPTSFLAHAQVTQGAGEPRPVSFTVNSPLRLDGASVYLLGHGYAPVLRYTDRFDRTQTVVAPFLPVDQVGTGEGVALFPDANVDPQTGQRDRTLQVAFEGLYLPTTPDGAVPIQSAHPEERAPGLTLIAYRGDLGMDEGRAQSVYRLNRDQVESGALQEIGFGQLLRPGAAMTLDDGTTLEFLGTRRWVTLSVRHDPGQPVALAGAVAGLIGLTLSLMGRRRRVWFRVHPEPGRSLISAGGLPRTDHPGFAGEFRDLMAALPLSVTDTPVAAPAASPTASPTAASPAAAAPTTPPTTSGSAAAQPAPTARRT